jgi:PAS domain S-box-containing protein
MKNPSYEDSSRKLVESLNLVLFVLDEQGKIDYISPGCTETLGLLPEEMIGSPISAFVKPEDKGRVGDMCEPVNQEATHPFSFPVVGKDGSFHSAMAISRSVFDSQEMAGMIGIIGEISSGSKTEKIIRQANTTIHLLNRIVRHDINNQLTVLNGYLSLMEQDDSTIKSPAIMRILLDATDKIQKLVILSKEFQDIGTKPPMWMNLCEVFQSALPTSGITGVQITTDPACQELELFCDPVITQVFQRLIDNSLHHGKTVSGISLHWRSKDGAAVIVYEDNGTGIQEIVKPTLFERAKGKKTGDGLFIVHEILAISGFTITETGEPGKGVRFEIVVPAGSSRVVKAKPQ